MTWLQLQCEGRIVAKANFHWRGNIENARLNWLQKQHDNANIKRNLSSEIKRIVEESVASFSRKIDSKLDQMILFQEQLVEVIVESLRSADDVGQIKHKRINNRKLRKSSKILPNYEQQENQQKFILSNSSALPLPSPPSSPKSDSDSESDMTMEELIKRKLREKKETDSDVAFGRLIERRNKRARGDSSNNITCRRSKNCKFTFIDGCCLPLPGPE